MYEHTCVLSCTPSWLLDSRPSRTQYNHQHTLRPCSVRVRLVILGGGEDACTHVCLRVNARLGLRICICLSHLLYTDGKLANACRSTRSRSSQKPHSQIDRHSALRPPSLSVRNRIPQNTRTQTGSARTAIPVPRKIPSPASAIPGPPRRHSRVHPPLNA